MDATTEAVLMGKPDPVVTTPAATPPVAQPILEKPAIPDSDKTTKVVPVIEQPAVDKPNETTVQQPPSKTPEQVVADAKKAEDDLKSALGMAESSEQKQQRLERDYAASSKEAKRLAESSKKLLARLKDQGIDVADIGGNIDLVANSKYSKDAIAFKVDFKDLDEKTQELAVEQPQKFIDEIVKRAQQMLVRAAPTIDHVIAPLSPERESEAVNFLVNDSYLTGEKKHADITENAGLIKQMLDVPTANKALKEFRDQAPEMALEYLNLKIRAAKQFLKDSAAKVIAAKIEKENKAAQVPDFGPSGGGSPSLGVASDDIGSAIAKAGHGY